MLKEKKLDELFFRWISQANVQAEIRQLVSLVRNGKKTNLVRLKEALSPTKEPPRSPTSAGHGRASKNIFASQSVTDSGNRVLRFGGSDDATGDQGGITDVLVASNGNDRLARKAATLMNDVDEGTKQENATGDDGNQDSAAASLGSLTDEEVRSINRVPAVTGEDGTKTRRDEEDVPNAPSSPSLLLAPEQTAPSAAPTTGLASNVLPKFYFPNEGGRGRGKPNPKDRYELVEERIKEVFKDKPHGIKPDEFVALTKEFCGLPSFLSTPLHCRVRWFYQRTLPNQEKISEQDALAISASKKKEKTGTPKDSNSSGVDTENALVTLDMFKVYWKHEIEPYDVTDRFFRLLKKIDSDVIYPSDFEVVLKELLAYHPGLEFLENTPEFQEKYARTVVARIFYSTDVSRSWSLRRRDVRKSNPPLLESFIRVDEEEDINLVHNFFSYEHFYVLYCKFWELDTDHDFYLSRDDLLRYGGHALTRRIVDRVFEQAGRRFLSPQKGKMTYEDFVFFMLSEEDKSNIDSLQYWFNCIDLDGDGEIRPYEMRSFYDEQLHRMECLGHEMVPFDNIVTQMMDIVGIPPGECVFRVEDFKRGGKSHMALTSVVFNMLFNLNKFIAYEQRDPFMMRQQRMESGDMTPWANFACLEYARLAMEEEEG